MRTVVIALLVISLLSFGCLETFQKIDYKGIQEKVIDVLSDKPEPIELPPGAQRYYTLKNLSCETLEGNFLIVTHDLSEGTIEGLIEVQPGELKVAEEILEDYSFNQTTRTYLLGDQMKEVVVFGNQEFTTVWKNGRIYNCTPDCSMRIMDQEDSDEYYDMIDKMRRRCAYFGKTDYPSFVNITRLLDIEYTERIDSDDFRCDNFLINGNKSYAEELLASNESKNFTEDQKTLLWAINHLDGPVTECLDESTGIIAFRFLTVDLTDSYRFNYSDDGFMKVNHQTTLEYFTTEVPESFLAVPG